MKIKVYHNGQEINWRIPKDSFPEIATAFKGDGYFDHEVSPISFKINKTGLTLDLNDTILIANTSGQVLLRGYIDEIGDLLANPVEVTVFPQSLKLKDIIAGSEVVINDDPDNEETAIDYHPEGFRSVRDIVADLALQASTETGWDFKTSAAAVPDPDVTGQRYFGNVLTEIVRGKLRLMDDSMHFRGQNGVIYLIKIDSGIVSKTMSEKGSWISKQIQIPGKDIDLGVTIIEKGSWLDFNLVTPPWDIKTVGVGAYYDIYKCEHGGITHQERIEWLPGDINIESQLNLKYGDKLDIYQYGNMTSQDSIANLLDGMGYNLDEVKAVIDTDPFNSYALVKANKKTNDRYGRDMLISLETSTDFYYQAHYRNMSAMEILKDLAVVTDRYLYIDTENMIHLFPRSGSIATLEISREQVIELYESTQLIDDVSVSVNRYEEDEEGEPVSFGLRIRDNEWSNLESNLHVKFTGKKREFTWKIKNPPAQIALANDILMDGSSYGILIQLSIDPLKNTAKFKTEMYNV